MKFNMDAVEAQIKKDAHLDDAQSAFFLRQLEYILPEAFNTEQKDLKARRLVPVDSRAPAGSRTITWRGWTRLGLAKIVSNYSTDFPRTNLYGEEHTVKVYDLGNSYAYTIPEIRAAQMTNVNLDTEYATATRRSMEEKLEEIAFQGEADYDIQGLLNYPGSTEYVVPADGTGSSKSWFDKTPTQILRDMGGITSAIRVPTNGKESPDTLVLPLAEYDYIAQTPFTSTGDSDKTIMRYFLDNNPFITNIEWLDELSTSGDGGVPQMMAYKKDPKKLKLHVPQEFEQMPPQLMAMEYVIHCHMTTAGVTVQYPLSVAFGDIGQV